ncbi:unnamed protein product [Didymodactylos carnosus]|uniref:Uncharacterized protein n=1 Tax=Didymodactylos carnosus TaxID=1234261 RepID=A0A814E216_9BILA|nr:unnamed protein product [Didymodactylos carnosus]CAF0961890.1 unnamed protein product [Didymodactylos carnosus]CAF3541050.1 unnamed protein product [Didymodactylos carnosus]CAF3736240.1 unnamed protein product [Didymodactylos carnosus]
MNEEPVTFDSSVDFSIRKETASVVTTTPLSLQESTDVNQKDLNISSSSGNGGHPTSFYQSSSDYYVSGYQDPLFFFQQPLYYRQVPLMDIQGKQQKLPRSSNKKKCKQSSNKRKNLEVVTRSNTKKVNISQKKRAISLTQKKNNNFTKMGKSTISTRQMSLRSGAKRHLVNYQIQSRNKNEKQKWKAETSSNRVKPIQQKPSRTTTKKINYTNNRAVSTTSKSLLRSSPSTTHRYVRHSQMQNVSDKNRSRSSIRSAKLKKENLASESPKNTNLEQKDACLQLNATVTPQNTFATKRKNEEASIKQNIDISLSDYNISEPKVPSSIIVKSKNDQKYLVIDTKTNLKRNKKFFINERKLSNRLHPILKGRNKRRLNVRTQNVPMHRVKKLSRNIRGTILTTKLKKHHDQRSTFSFPRCTSHTLITTAPLTNYLSTSHPNLIGDGIHMYQHKSNPSFSLFSTENNKKQTSSPFITSKNSARLTSKNNNRTTLSSISIKSTRVQNKGAKHSNSILSAFNNKQNLESLKSTRNKKRKQ